MTMTNLTNLTSVLKGDCWKDELLGLTIDQRIAQMVYAKLLERHVEDCIQEGKPVFDASMVAVVNRENRLEDVGFSMPNDLILDNFGRWLAAMFAPPQTDTTQVTVVDSGGTSRNPHVWGPRSTWSRNMWHTTNLWLGTKIQIGQSANAPARTNFTVGQAFGTSPESGRVGTGNGSYTDGSGVVYVAMTLVSGGSGTIREAGLYLATNVIGTAYDIMLFHSSLTPTTFTAGKTITVTWSLFI